MAGVKALVALAFLASCGITCLILACALPDFSNWYPMFLLAFYILVPLPCVIAARSRDSYDRSGGLGWELALFLTTGIVISAYGLPIILALTPEIPVIKGGACALIVFGNTIIFTTWLGFYQAFRERDGF